MSLMRSRPSPAMIVAALALVLALGGTAIAAPDIATKKVTQKKVKKIAKQQAKKQIKKKAPGLSVNHANTADTASPTGPAGGDLAGTYPDPLIGDEKVTTQKIATDAVTAAKIGADQVGTSEIAASAVDTTKIADNAVTATKIADNSVTSGKIADGQVRGPDLGQVIVRNASDVIPTGTSGIVTVACQGNEVRLSGGGFFNAVLQANKGLQASFAFGNSGWAIVGRNNSGANQTLNAQAVCLQGA